MTAEAEVLLEQHFQAKCMTCTLILLQNNFITIRVNKYTLFLQIMHS